MKNNKDQISIGYKTIRMFLWRKIPCLVCKMNTVFLKV